MFCVLFRRLNRIDAVLLTAAAAAAAAGGGISSPHLILGLSRSCRSRAGVQRRRRQTTHTGCTTHIHARHSNPLAARYRCTHIRLLAINTSRHVVSRRARLTLMIC